MTADSRVVMPQLGESIVEATIVRWRVKPGEQVARGQILAEVETDKATNEIPAPIAGTIGELLIAEGATVPVGTPILTFGSRPADTRLPAIHLPNTGGPIRNSPAVRRLAREHN